MEAGGQKRVADDFAAAVAAAAVGSKWNEGDLDFVIREGNEEAA